jgi:pyrroline-5-carboxylate reductase
MKQKVAIVGAGNVGKALREGFERTGAGCGPVRHEEANP